MSSVNIAKQFAKDLLYRLGFGVYNMARNKPISVKYSAFDPQHYRLIPRGQANYDPNVFGRYNLNSQRVVPIAAEDDSPAADLDLLMAAAQSAGNATAAISRDRYAVVLRQLEPGSGLCLDACTGSPRADVVATVEGHGYTYQAIDLHGGGRDVWKQDLTSLSLAQGSVARVLSVDTLEHIPEWRTAIGEIFRVLQPSGIAFVHVPCYFFEKSHGEPIDPSMDHYGHIRYFAARELLAAFANAGFIVLRVELIMDYGASLCVLMKPDREAA